MAIVFTELVKKGTNSGSTGGGDKYLNTIKMMTNQYRYDYSTSTPILLSGSLDLTQEYFDADKDEATLYFPGNIYLNSIETPENIARIFMVVNNCENLKTVSLLGYGYTSGSQAHSGERFFGNEFEGCINLTTINLPKFYGDLIYGFVSDAVGSNNLEKVIIPNVYSISSGFFTGCDKLKVVDFRRRTSSEIPQLGSASDFCQDPSVNCTMVIPDNLYDTWTHSGAWYTLYSSSNYHFVRESEYVE